VGKLYKFYAEMGVANIVSGLRTVGTRFL
jgi:hypothetical protein